MRVSSVDLRRLAIGMALVICTAVTAIVVGTAAGARLVPEGSGLAGPAIALGHGAAAAAVGAVLAIVAALRLSRPALGRATVGAFAATIVSIAVVLALYARNREAVGAAPERALQQTAPIVQ